MQPQDPTSLDNENSEDNVLSLRRAHTTILHSSSGAREYQKYLHSLNDEQLLEESRLSIQKLDQDQQSLSLRLLRKGELLMSELSKRISWNSPDLKIQALALHQNLLERLAQLSKEFL